MFSRFNCRDEYYDKTYRYSKHNGVEAFFIKSGLNFHPPTISQNIFQIFNINEKLNNISWNRRNIENQTRLHKCLDPIMVNLPLTYRILTYRPKKNYRFIFKSGLNFYQPAVSQYIFQTLNFRWKEKLNNISWNRRNIENQTQLHKHFDPIMVNLPPTYRVFNLPPPKRIIGLFIFSCCILTNFHRKVLT